MLRRLLANRSLLATAVSGTLVAALVTTFAITSEGFEAQEFELGDGTVWVANGGQQAIGRANVDLLALDTVVTGSSSDIEVVQQGSTVLMLDASNARLDVVDPATAGVETSVPIPAGAPQVRLAGANAVVSSAATGEIWITPTAALADFEAGDASRLTLGSAVSVSPSGELFAYSQQGDTVSRVEAASSARVDGTADSGLDADARASVSITSVSGLWVLFDAASRMLSIEGREVDLAGLIDAGDEASVQVAADEGDRVLVAHSGGLVSVPLAGGDPVEVAPGRSGTPAAPVVVDGCSFAAWSDGEAWRDCGDGSAIGIPLEATATATATAAGVGEPAANSDAPASDAPASAGLAFAVNGDRVVLNDPRDGRSWAVQQNGESIDNWGDMLAGDRDEQEADENEPEIDPDVATSQSPPVAVDDEFGARPGRSTLLPVLLNDYDPNGDVLVVEGVTGVDESVARVEVVDDGQSIQLTLDPLATGTVGFSYEVTDGRGGRAEGRVTVAVRTDAENGAPTQVRRTSTAVAAGGSATTSVLGDWVDPDGDPMYLADATVAAPDEVTHQPEGEVVFREAGGAGSTRPVTLTVSDGRAEGTGGLSVFVGAAGSVDIVAEPFVVVAYVGEEVTVEPLGHVEGGTGPIRLTSVPAKQGSTIEELENGSFRFRSDEPRTHLIDYVVSDGVKSATGVVRIEVRPTPTDDLTPITTPKTVFLEALTSESLDVTATDIDPTGGVLLVTGVEGLDPLSGVTADVLDQATVRVRLVAPLTEGRVTFSYRVSNGVAEAVGSITVIEIPAPDELQPPVAQDDLYTARTGAVSDFPVLDNDLQPDGKTVSLDPNLVRAPGAGAGLLFAAGDGFRYLSPKEPGNYSWVYQIEGPDGQVDQAQLTIAVREPVAETNLPPAPAEITARVVAGQTVRITVPLTGVDPDGDAVQLLGQATAPEMGTVVEAGTDYLDYTAAPAALGTDSFTYTLVDTLGATSSGVVRIGIGARTESSGIPTAIGDEVSARPGASVSVPVLENDFDPDGGRLSIVSVESNGADLDARLAGDVIELTAPRVPGRYALSYTIQNETGGSASAFVAVQVDPAATRSTPVATDSVLTLSDIRDRESVDVAVLDNVFFADGAASTLVLSVLPGYDTAEVTDEKHLEIQVTENQQIIPFSVAHPDDPSIVAYAFVWVPGYADALPQLDRSAPPLSVESGSRLVIDLEDHVIVAAGRSVRIADTASVRATHANGDGLIVGESTIAFTSAPGYAGQASVSFTVADGPVGDDDTREATLVLPIEVIADEVVPPVFTGGTVAFEPGQRKILDLTALTTFPAPGNIDELVYTLLSRDPAGFDVEVSGRSITVTADDAAVPGAEASVTIGVRSPLVAGDPGAIRFQVVPSSRPLAVAVADSITAVRGETTRVDVLGNDEATNPFPGTPLRVVSVRGAGSSELPAGITVTPEGSTLAVTVASGAQAVDTTLQYGIRDATDDAGREVFGRVTISVQDRPDTPAAPSAADAAEEGVVALRITPPEANNSPVTSYTITSPDGGGYRHDCGTALICTLDDLAPGVDYSFSVIATNAVGASAPSPGSEPIGIDFVPQAPGEVTAAAVASSAGAPTLRIVWAEVPDPARGTAVTGYTVAVTGPGLSWSTTTSAGATSLETTADGALVAGVEYVATVYARNRASISDGEWRRTSSAPVRPIGPPSAVAGGVVATAAGAAGEILVEWGASDPNGGSTVAYSVGRFAGTEAPPTSCTPGAEHPGLAAGSGGRVSAGWTDQETTDAASYRYAVYSENELYCTVSASAVVQSLAAPAAPAVSTLVVDQDGRLDARVDAISTTGPTSVYEVSTSGAGAWTPVAAGEWLTSTGGSSVYGATAYGTPLALEYRACRADAPAVCGPSSGVQTVLPVDTRGSVLSCAVNGRPEVAAPSNGGSPTYVYTYAFDTGTGVFSEFLPDDVVPEPILGGTTLVRLKVTVILDGGSFTDSGFAQGACTA